MGSAAAPTVDHVFPLISTTTAATSLLPGDAGAYAQAVLHFWK